MKTFYTVLKRALIFLLFFFLKPFKTLTKPSNSLLIVTTTGLGDTLWATPAIRELKKAYPEKRILVLTNALGEQIFHNNPFIDEIIIWKKPSLLSIFSLLYLRKEPFEKIFLFHASQRIVFILLGLLNAKDRVATKGMNKDMDFIFSDLKEKRNIHEVQRRLNLVGMNTDNLDLDFFLTEEEKIEAKKTLMSLGINLKRPLIGLHPGAKDRYKCLSIDRFSKIALELQKKWPAQFYLSGQEQEQDLIDILEKNIPNSFSLKNLSLRKFAALLSFCDLIITNDTGPMHLASAIKKDVIALFSPTDPQLCGPLSKNAHVFYKKKSCSTCLKRKCLEPFCLLQIPSHVIVQKADTLLTTASNK